MPRTVLLLMLTLGMLTAGSAIAGSKHGHHDRHDDGYRCDHPAHRQPSHRPFYGDDYGYRYNARPSHRGRYGNAYRSHQHTHRYRAVAWIEPYYRDGWRHCPAHGGYFRIGDFHFEYYRG